MFLSPLYTFDVSIVDVNLNSYELDIGLEIIPSAPSLCWLVFLDICVEADHSRGTPSTVGYNGLFKHGMICLAKPTPVHSFLFIS